jgi:hypothetical protein
MRAMSAAAAVVHARVQLRARGAAKLRATHIRGVAVRARAVPLRVRCGPQPDLESDGTLDFPQVSVAHAMPNLANYHPLNQCARPCTRSCPPHDSHRCTPSDWIHISSTQRLSWLHPTHVHWVHHRGGRHPTLAFAARCLQRGPTLCSVAQPFAPCRLNQVVRDAKTMTPTCPRVLRRDAVVWEARSGHAAYVALVAHGGAF